MKQKLLLFCFVASLSISGQTITSQASGDWNNIGTWVGGVVPVLTDNVIISHLVTVPTAYNAQANSITIGGGGTQLIMNADSSLDVTGDFTVTRSNDGITFIAQNGEMGTIIFGGVDTNGRRISVRKRLPSNDEWYLVSSPFIQSRLSEIFGINSPNIVTNGNNFYSFASYNDANATGFKYEYFSSTAIYANGDYVTDGQGYSTKVNNGGNTADPFFYMRGKLNADAVAVDITDDADGNSNGFNLVGNPYAAYLHSNLSADATNNLLTVNESVLEEATIWFWDGLNKTFITKNLGDGTDAAFRINPMQGFFVKAKSGGSITESFNFTEAMQSHSKTDNYFKTTTNKFTIDLSISNGNINRNTSIRYTDNATTSFDNGYDSSTFGGYGSDFEVYTELIESQIGKKLAIQSLPNENYEDMIIPIGVKASANSEITFSAEALNVPENYKVFLEDRTNNTFTRLDEPNALYKTIVLDVITNGRFFLHTAQKSVLSINAGFLNSVSIYKTSNSNLKITGLQNGKATVSLVNTLGKQVMKSTFIASHANNITLPKLTPGVYIIQLTTEIGKLNKKIILE